MWVMFRDLFKTVFGDILTDLGNLEGDYRVSQLKSDITQSLLYMFIVSVGVLAMLEVDKKLFAADHDVFMLVTTTRILFVLISIGFAIVLYRVDKVRVFDHLTFAWMILVVSLMLIFNFMTPTDYLSTSFDIIVPFAIYILSPLPIKRTVGLAACFSIGTLGVYFFLK